mmetsp:Transcript_19431/g.45972  ORF Transcript_19431/g.45972 Transcript_19431/m.45972 type:complete len:866 (+) Transcript_19431:158-2755(+)
MMKKQQRQCPVEMSLIGMIISTATSTQEDQIPVVDFTTTKNHDNDNDSFFCEQEETSFSSDHSSRRNVVAVAASSCSACMNQFFQEGAQATAQHQQQPPRIPIKKASLHEFQDFDIDDDDENDDNGAAQDDWKLLKALETQLYEEQQPQDSHKSSSCAVSTASASTCDLPPRQVTRSKDDDDDEEEEDEVDQATGGEISNAMGDTEVSPAFRGRPVKDPWNKNAQQQQQSSSSLFGGKAASEEDVSLQKVRRNQQRLQEERGNKQQQHKQSPKRQEFYDEDDEGYDGGEGSLDFMIRPKPAGGQGTTRGSTKVNPSSPTAGSGSFFFRDTSKDEPQSPSEASATPSKSKTTINGVADGKDTETAQPKSTTNRKPKPSVPLVDPETGAPLLLTLEQAEQNFRQTLVTSTEQRLDDLSESLNFEDEDDDSKYNMLASSSTWQDLGITDSVLLENLEDMGCAYPLSVQEKALPDIMAGKDVVVGTYTGSGKTLAFLTPLVQRLLNGAHGDEKSGNNNGVRAVVVAPGRELASQIVSVARELLQGSGLTVMLAIGGTTFSRNLEQLRKRKPDIVVGTPGRLAELIVGRPGERTGRLKTASFETVVLDEFDALLEYKAHREPTTALLDTLQRRYKNNIQSVWCSATASDVIDSAKLKTFLDPDYAIAMADQNDLIVTSGKSNKRDNLPRVSKTVIHSTVHVEHRRFVLETVRRILHTEPVPQQILIFVENARKVDLTVERLDKMGIVAAALHGGMRSEKMDRAEVSKALREGFVGIVVATELAARGLDAPLLTHVINMDLPTDASHYAHRAGRCGRGGRPGVVINLTADPKERNVPQKFADQLGIEMFTTEVRNGKLNLVDPKSQQLDSK